MSKKINVDKFYAEKVEEYTAEKDGEQLARLALEELTRCGKTRRGGKVCHR